MAAPSSYTETTLAEFMQSILQDVATTMGWTAAPDDYQEAINETLLMMGVDSIAAVSGRENIKKLRVYARVEVWRQVMAATSGDYDFSADGGSYKRSQVHEQAKANYALALQDAMAYGLDGYQVTIDTVRYVHDPYQYVEDEDRVTP
jgi:hypothetical protein